MRLLLLAYSLDPGGAERQFVNLAKALAEKGVDVHIATFYGGGRLEREVASFDGIRLVSLGKSGRRDFARFGWRMRRYVGQHHFDIVYSFLSGPNVVALLARTLRTRPRIIWGVRASPLDYSHYEQTVRWVERAERLLSPLTDRIVVNSRAGLKDWLKSGYPEAKLTHIPNGIDTQRFIPDPNAYDSVRQEIGVPVSTPLIGLVGRSDPRKDHKTFLEGAAALRRRIPETHFLCIGRTAAHREPYAQELRLYESQFGLTPFVHWLGDRTDVPRLMASLNVLTSSSAFGEGFPNVVAEGMACGAPCVVTDVGDSAYIVGDTGTILPPRDPEALADGWAKILALPRDRQREMGKRARARVEQFFSVDRMAEETLRVLQAV